MRRRLGPQLSPRVAVFVIVLPALLVAAVLTGQAREHRELPAAAQQVRLAVDDAAELLSCFQGVQDELSIPGQVHPSAQQVRSARSRLLTCHLGPLRARLDATNVPAAAAVTGDTDRVARQHLAGAASALRRVILEAEGTRKAMSLGLRSDRQGAEMVLGYRAAEAGYERAVVLLSTAEAMLRPSI
jgi:hypothetical protein